MANRHAFQTNEIASVSSLSSLSCLASMSSPHYDLFINHRGPDVKATFAAALYSCLSSSGLQVFFDKPEMHAGHDIPCQIKHAIETASIHITIFSPTYAKSRWCLIELEHMLKMHKSGNAIIIPVFYKVDPSELRWTGTGTENVGPYAKALRKHEEKHRTSFQTIQNWRDALYRAAGISGFDLTDCHGIQDQLLSEVVGHVLDIREKKRLKYVTRQNFETLVLSHEKIKHRYKANIVGIVGPGGVGKTTLAREFFNSKRSEYSGSCFLTNVKEGSRGSLEKKLYEDLLEIGTIFEGIYKLLKLISSSSAHRKVLLVFDDVDHVDQMDVVLQCRNTLGSNSLILVTSRDKDILEKTIGEEPIYNPTGLSTHLHTRHPRSSLILAGSWLEKLPPWLDQLTSLQELWLRDSPNFEGLSSSHQVLNQLTELTITDCEIKSLLQDPAKMSNLRVLRVYNCPLGELSLRKVAKVRKIIIQIDDKFRAGSRKPLRQGVCPHLKHLWINSCGDLVKVESLSTALVTLDLSYCKKLMKIDGIRYLTRLEQLDISGCEEVEELPNLRLLTSLKELKASRCYKLRRIQGLAHLSTNLRILYVRECREIRALLGVERLMSLEQLDAHGCHKLWLSRRVINQLRHRLKGDNLHLD